MRGGTPGNRIRGHAVDVQLSIVLMLKVCGLALRNYRVNRSIAEKVLTVQRHFR
jgi:hypothetical protein